VDLSLRGREAMTDLEDVSGALSKERENSGGFGETDVISRAEAEREGVSPGKGESRLIRGGKPKKKWIRGRN